MLRLVLLVLIVSGAWASWQSLAEWRSGLIHTVASPDMTRRSQPLTFAVPAELLPPQQWASVEPATATDAALPDTVSERRAPQVGEPKPSPQPADEAQASQQAGTAAEAVKPDPVQRAAAEQDTPPADQLPAAIQTELKRLGFYRGRVDNIWGSRSRAALRNFAQAHGVSAGDEPTIEVYRTANAATPVASARMIADNPKPVSGQRQAVKHAAKAAPEESSYLPPWLSSGEAEPAPQRAQVATRRVAAAAQRPAGPTRAERQRQAERRHLARQRTTIEEHFRRNGYLWPGF